MLVLAVNRSTRFAVLCLAALLVLVVGGGASAGESLKLHLRTRVETFKGSGTWDEVLIEKEIPARLAAIVICDMWDNHWCSGAAKRCDQLAAKMDPVVKAARAKGVKVIHSPSDTMGFYAQWPQRQRMMAAQPAQLPTALQISEPALPIDDSDGGCDSGEKPWYKAWTRQNARIEIDESDVISDNGAEVYSFLKQQGIRYIIYMGVHTNMCVLNRSFAIRQMTRWGFHCILTRDLTDAMYDPSDPPHVSHDQGTQLVIQHIEKYWGPSILSSDLSKP